METAPQSDDSIWESGPPAFGCLLHVPDLPALPRVISSSWPYAEPAPLEARGGADGDGAGDPTAIGHKPSHKWAAAEARFATHGVAVVDDVLSAAAQHAALRLVRESVAWYGKGRAGLKANVEDGLHAGGLLLQLAAELREVMPAALGGHAIRRAWAYKAHDTDAHQGVEGLGAHSEPYAATALLFLTPDDANLAPANNPDAGGLIVYHARMADVSGSQSWSYRSRQEREALAKQQEEAKEAEMKEDAAETKNVTVMTEHSEPARRALAEQAEATKERLLAETGWANTTIAFRFNRLVLFRSCRLHETKRPAYFKPGFVNRRASAAMLFGEGGVETCA